MDDAHSKLLVVGTDGNAAAQAAQAAPCLMLSVKAPQGEAPPTLEVVSRTAGFEVVTTPPAAGEQLEEAPQPEDVGLFLHTSGTTSRPKVLLHFPVHE